MAVRFVMMRQREGEAKLSSWSYFDKYDAIDKKGIVIATIKSIELRVVNREC
jgi:hypothetical protein